MLICTDCGRVFDSPRHIVERHGLDAPPYEEYDACPFCFSTDIHPAKQCDLCGGWLTGTYVETADGQRFCEECYSVRDVADG